MNEALLVREIAALEAVDAPTTRHPERAPRPRRRVLDALDLARWFVEGVPVRVAPEALR